MSLNNVPSSDESPEIRLWKAILIKFLDDLPGSYFEYLEGLREYDDEPWMVVVCRNAGFPYHKFITKVESAVRGECEIVIPKKVR